MGPNRRIVLGNLGMVSEAVDPSLIDMKGGEWMKSNQKLILAAVTLVLAVGFVLVVSANSGTDSQPVATGAQSIGTASGSSHDCPCGVKAGCAENGKTCPSFKDANKDGVCDQRGTCPSHEKCRDNCGQGCQSKCTPHAGGCRHGS